MEQSHEVRNKLRAEIKQWAGEIYKMATVGQQEGEVDSARVRDPSMAI